MSVLQYIHILNTFVFIFNDIAMRLIDLIRIAIIRKSLNFRRKIVRLNFV